MLRHVFPALAALAVLSIASPGLAQQATIDGIAVRFQQVLEGLERPVALMSPPGDERLFIAEKTGRILILTGQQEVDVFLDLTKLVSTGNEQGLLGLAFDPNYQTNHRFLVNYTDKEGDTQIVAYVADEIAADRDSAKTILTIRQPFDNHNGGWLGFGPDGLLYIGVGDGGSGGDPQGNGQNKDVLLGKMLRIDVNGNEPYAIPPGNPFAGGGGAPEVFLTGLRNPWRNSFDGDTLFLGDVGQNAIEEIDAVDLKADVGANLGWNTLEGAACYPEGSMCVQGGFLMPIHTYSHDEGCSVTGGFVYRGKALPALDGRYFFADYCIGTLRSLRYADGVASGVTDAADTIGSVGPINAFGVDSEGELYVLTDDGFALKLVAAE
ncbi:MAG: PQQ-dependent sugar dehydrogenase [Devosia sp.]